MRAALMKFSCSVSDMRLWLQRDEPVLPDSFDKLNWKNSELERCQYEFKLMEWDTV